MPALWNSQFYAPYTDYPKRIVSIGGNHDGKSSPVTDYLDAFCADPSNLASAVDRQYHRPAGRR